MGLFDKLHEAAGGILPDVLNAGKAAAKRMAIQTALDKCKPAIESRAGMYAELLSLTCEEDFTIKGSIRIRGMNDIVMLSLKKYEIAEDNSWVKITEMSASAEGVNNLIKDFLVGRPFDIPEKHRGYIAAAKKTGIV